MNPDQLTAPALLQFSCTHCQTILNVPLSFAGVTAPCPCCAQPITAPSASSSLPSAPVITQCPAPLVELKSRRPLALAGLAAALVGMGWAAWQYRPQAAPAVAIVPVMETPAVPAQPVDQRATALTRSTEAVKQFLAANDWDTARSMIAPQDTPGSTPDAAFQPNRFQALATQGKFNPLAINPKENANQFQIVWEIQNPNDADKLMLTADDTAEGVRIRWYQPPYFVATTQGTVPAPAMVAAQTPPPAPAPVEVAPPAAPEPAPAAVTILAAIDAATSPPSQGSAPLNNEASKVKAEEKPTASAKTKPRATATNPTPSNRNQPTPPGR